MIVFLRMCRRILLKAENNHRPPAFFLYSIAFSALFFVLLWIKVFHYSKRFQIFLEFTWGAAKKRLTRSVSGLSETRCSSCRSVARHSDLSTSASRTSSSRPNNKKRSTHPLITACVATENIFPSIFFIFKVEFILWMSISTCRIGIVVVKLLNRWRFLKNQVILKKFDRSNISEIYNHIRIDSYTATTFGNFFSNYCKINSPHVWFFFFKSTYLNL